MKTICERCNRHVREVGSLKRIKVDGKVMRMCFMCKVRTTTHPEFTRFDFSNCTRCGKPRRIDTHGLCYACRTIKRTIK